ncbi:CatB-related O-acetyltransferase [Enterococcus rivorum]|uniref:CatB-related O-acetyltransferase n=1 Tax=Enterococcus rivorum TaxID=762845 RepID=UPI00362CB46D
MNEHNYTTASNVFDVSLVSVGNFTYGALEIIDFKEMNAKVEIGNFCSIAKGVKFLMGGEHDYKKISTYPFKRFLSEEFVGIESFSRGPIVIEDDVWIGRDVLILSGVTVRQGAIIGAGSVVRESVPPYSIFVGNKVIKKKKRFSDDVCKKLECIDWSTINEKDVLENLDSLYEFSENKINENSFYQFFSNKNLKKDEEI